MVTAAHLPDKDSRVHETLAAWRPGVKRKCISGLVETSPLEQGGKTTLQQEQAKRALGLWL